MIDPGASAVQWSAFLGDLRFVACGCSLALYAAWQAAGRKSFAGMGRIGLSVAFGATVVAFVLGKTPLSLPFTDFYLFVLLALFLILEFLFEMSVLGLFVSIIGTAVASAHYWLNWGPLGAPLPTVAAYWELLRDMMLTLGVAASTLCYGAAVLIALQPGRRSGGPLVHPNDLRDVAGLLARAGCACFFFATAFEGGAIARAAKPGWLDTWSLGWLFVLFVVSVAWVMQTDGRRYVGPRVLSLIASAILPFVAYAARGLVATALLGAPHLH